jgi:hypothetical protein
MALTKVSYSMIKGAAINVMDYGATGDGTTNDTAAIQAAMDAAVTQNKTLYFPSGVYYTTTAINISNAGIQSAYIIRGEGAGDAYGDYATGASIIKTNGNDAFTITATYGIFGLTMTGLKMVGNPSLKTGYLLNMTMGSTSSMNNLWMTDVAVTLCSGLYRAGSDVPNSNAPFTYITRAWSWDTRKVIYLNQNVGSTIFVVAESLFHGTTENAFHFQGPGTYLQTTSVWFEGCQPWSIYKEGTGIGVFSLHDTFFEDFNANQPAMEIGNYCNVTLTGKTNLPGAFMEDYPVIFRQTTTFANYTDKIVPIRALGGVILTPSTVSLHQGFSHLANIPYECGEPTNNGVDVYPDSIAGTDVGNSVDYASAMPMNVAQDFAPASTNDIARGGFSRAVATDSLLCASFIFENDAVNNGLGVNASFTIDGTVYPLFPNQFYFPPDSIGKVFYVVAALPIYNGSTATDCWIPLQSSAWRSYASVFTTTDLNLNNMLPVKGRRKSEKATIAASGSKTFIAKQSYQQPYTISTKFVVNNGQKGQYLMDTSGIAEDTKKYRYPENQINDGSVTFTPADGAHERMASVTCANGTASSIAVTFEWGY